MLLGMHFRTMMDGVFQSLRAIEIYSNYAAASTY
jgi:hypothetical protein